MKARIPAGTVAYAIGDVHGCHELLAQLLARVEEHARRSTATRRILVLLGDYVSRGPDSRRVVEMLLAPPPAGFERVCLKGNHEDLLLRFIDGELEAGRYWSGYDGLDTLADYGVAATADGLDDATLEAMRCRFAASMPPAHLALLRALPVRFRLGDYFFVHAGVRPGVALEEQDPRDLMWIREPFLDSPLDHGAIVVHGHQVVTQVARRGNRIGIDTGACRSGVLTCLALEGTGLELLQT